MRTVDVMIPVYRPSDKLLLSLELLNKQTHPVNRIIIMNTEELYYNRFKSEHTELGQYLNVSVFHLSKREFDHGATRALAVSKSHAEYFVFMTDDAIPYDENLISNLLEPIESGKASFSYARQLARQDAGIIEQYTRVFNYPEDSFTKSLANLDSLGIKTYFFSNVCAAYDRKIYEELGGFERHIIFNEDMVFAARAINAGYKIAYVAQAQVYHSHSYGCKAQFHRNFDLGVSQAMHPDIFDEVPSVGEGKRLIRQTNEYLRSSGNRKLIFGNYVKSGFKFLGYQFGKHYRILPDKLVLKWSDNEAFWVKEHNLKEKQLLQNKDE